MLITSDAHWNPHPSIDGLHECASECFSRRIRFVQFSIIRKHMLRDRVVTNYIRTRLSMQNEKNMSQDRALGDPTSRKRGRRFYFIRRYCFCPALQVRIGERQSKTKKNTESDFEASQKNVMIDNVEGRA